MSADISPEVIKLTQENLGKFIKKPPLTEKLLKKPPFRFLHDITTAVIKNTGFFDGLFSDEELISDNIKDRESKIAFLQKIIEVLDIVTESSLTTRPSKVIAGLEPEKTNELLQKIGYALQQNLSSKQAVEFISKRKGNPIKAPPTNTNDKNQLGQNKPAKTVKSDALNKNKIPTQSERKNTKEKSKSEINNTEKNSTRTNKVEASKKVKVNEKVLKTSKTNGEIKKTLKKSDNTIKSTGDEQNKPSINEPHHLLGNIVELKDIIDSDELNSIDKEQSDKLESPVVTNSVDHLQLNDLNPEVVKPKETTITRPQSRISRKPSASNHPQSIPDSSPELRPPDVATENSTQINALGENIKNGDDKANSELSEKSELSTELVEIKKPTPRSISSGRRSAQIKPGTLKNNHSLSIESKSEDAIDQKSLSSNESENKVLERPRTSLRPPSVRPSSARPGAPRLKDRNSDVIVTTAEPVLVGKVNVIVENYDNQIEDDEGSVEVLQITADDKISNTVIGDTKIDTIASGHGHLVQQILETQKELATDEAPKVEIEWEWGARKEREASYKEVESIRNGLQALSRASNPLGKLMDYIQEDVEVMRQELIQWRDARLSAAAELKHQQSLTEQQIQPLLAKLKQLEDQIVEQTESVHTVKSNIYRNSLKITKLVDGDD